MDRLNIFLSGVCFVFFLIGCNNNNQKVQEKISIIEVEKSLADFYVESLSSYSSQIRYVKLETTEKALVTEGVKQIFIEDDKLFVWDQDAFLKVFDANNGNYLFNIGKYGQGPGELPHLSYVDINPKEKRVLLCYGPIVNEFDFEGVFLSRVEKPMIDSTETISYNVVLLDKNLFAAGIRAHTEKQKHAIVIFDRNKQILASLNSFDDPKQHHSIKVWDSFMQTGHFWRDVSDIRFYRGITDTIYLYNPINKNFQPEAVFSFGKHRSTHSFTPGTENPDVIKLASALIPENKEYAFYKFFTKRASPEPYETEVWINQQMHSVLSNNIFGIYNKKKRELHYLLQAIPGIPGLKNDLDNGIPFWPQYISSNGSMIDYYQSYKFIELSQKLDNPDKSFLEFIQTCSEEDNPVVIIVK